MSQTHRLAGGLVDRAAHARLHLQWPGDGGPPRRHAGLGAARQRPAAGGPLVQVSPAARHPQRRVRGAERAGDAARGRAGRAEHPGDDGGAFRRAERPQPEPPRPARLRPDGGQRPALALPERGVLLQDLHVAEGLLGKALRAGDPRLGRARPALGRARPGQLRQGLPALRPAGDRRRPGGARGGAGGGPGRRAGDPRRRGFPLRRPAATPRPSRSTAWPAPTGPRRQWRNSRRCPRSG